MLVLGLGVNAHSVQRQQQWYAYECLRVVLTDGEDVQKHIYLHLDNPKNVCDWPECGRTFNSTADLAIHSSAHREQRRFVCSQCGNTLFLASDLRVSDDEREKKSQYSLTESTDSHESTFDRHEDVKQRV